MTAPDTVSLEETLVRRGRPAIEWEQVEGETIVWNADTEELHRLDPIATLIFDLCAGGVTLAELLGLLAEAFEIPAAVIERDVRSGVDLLRRSGLILHQRAMA